MDLGEAKRELQVEPVQWPMPCAQPKPERVEEPAEAQ